MATPDTTGQQRRIPGQATRNVSAAVCAAKHTGYVIGRRVCIGVVTGVIVGYNIARSGCFVGNRYPLLVQTDFGVAKCAVSELRLG